MTLNTTVVQSVSFVLFLLALPLASFGAMEDIALLWGAALVLLLVAGILPPAMRFVDLDDEDGDAGGDEGDAARDESEAG